MTKIDIISGFLGAGKTTFIKKLLEEAISGEKVILIENEFGEIGIDGGFLKDSGIEIREMNSGCICCSLVGDFGKSLEEVLTTYHPDRVLIEPSGVGKLSDVTKAVLDVSEKLDVVLNMSVTVVDATKCKMYMKNFGEFFNDQIENAGTIVVSRTDIASKDKVDKAVEMLREHNANAVIVTTPIEELNGSEMLELIEKPVDMESDLMKEVLAAREKEEQEHEHHHHHHDGECCCHDHDHEHEEHEHHHHHEHEDGECCCHDHDHEHEEHEHHHHHDGECCHGHHHHHHADEVFTSIGLENVKAMKKEALEEILKAMAHSEQYGQVLRAKGMIPSETLGEWIYFDLVPEQYEIRSGKPELTGKICVIGSKLAETAIKAAFGKQA
ncbi:MAG: GTP-binding protein [bacterium]|nr:GTP-binding protein [bacterium]